MTVWLGVDTGGTFTDFVVWSQGALRIHKVLSTPEAPERAVLQGIDELGLAQAMADGELVIVHGTTVATNAALEGKGARTLFITNRGLEDILTIGRQTRAELYNLTPPTASNQIPQTEFLGVDSRVSAQGEVLRTLSDDALQALKKDVDAASPSAVAISLLFDFLNADDERRIEETLKAPGRFVCRASALLPLAGEYERGVATWLNAWLGPKVAEYLNRLDGSVGKSSLSVMQSHGGTIEASLAAQQAVNLLLSGPAGGLNAARQVALALGESKVMTFDMGGTSTDVALIDGDIRLTLEGRIGPWPVAVPMVEMHTIGAGGGSLARVDEAGMLHVGPESAGAQPGPACYGQGGTGLTVTDANLLMGRLQPNFALGGSLLLNVEPAERACANLATELGMSSAETLEGVLALANEHMAQALRVISIQKGHDPADFALLCFGGAGGLHVCDLAETLGMRRAIVPLNSGVLSAQGMLQAPRQRELLTALPEGADVAHINALADGLRHQGGEALLAEGVAADQVQHAITLDLCYRGQSFTLPVPWLSDMARAEAQFHQDHAQVYGHALDLPVSAINVRVRTFAPAHTLSWPKLDANIAEPCARVPVIHEASPVPVYQRDALGRDQKIDGPALIIEPVATTFVKSGWQLHVHAAGHLFLAIK